jgi:tetratricopeptide (TPR) repeat protein
MKQLALFLGMIFLCLVVPYPLVAIDRSGYFQQWKDLSQSNQFSRAVTVFEQAVLDYPKEAWFEIFLAHAYRMLDKPEKALPYYEKALQLDAKTKGIIDNVYAGYAAYAWFLGASRNDWDSAAQWYAKAVILSPDNSEAYNLQGNALRNAGKTEQALTAFETAFAKDPSHVNGPLKDNFRVGMEVGIDCAKRLDDVAILDRYAELALKAYPNDEALALEAFSALLTRKQMDRAAKIYESAKAASAACWANWEMNDEQSNETKRENKDFEKKHLTSVKQSQKTDFRAR